MAELSKNEMIKLVGDMIVERATKIACDEIEAFGEKNQNELIDKEVRALVIQRAVSELMFRMNHFHYEESDNEEQNLREHFDRWLLMDEEPKLRQICQGNLREEIAKRRQPGEEAMTFTEKFLKKVREEGKKNNTIDIMRHMNQ